MFETWVNLCDGVYTIHSYWESICFDYLMPGIWCLYCLYCFDYLMPWLTYVPRVLNWRVWIWHYLAGSKGWLEKNILQHAIIPRQVSINTTNVHYPAPARGGHPCVSPDWHLHYLLRLCLGHDRYWGVTCDRGWGASQALTRPSTGELGNYTPVELGGHTSLLAPASKVCPSS